MNQQTDADLIAACQIAETAHHAMIAACLVVSGLDTRTPEGAAANAVYLQHADTLWGQVDALCELRPQTPEGHIAMARLVVVIANDYGPLEGGEEEEEDISFDFVPKPLIRTIIENLAGRAHKSVRPTAGTDQPTDAEPAAAAGQAADPAAG